MTDSKLARSVAAEADPGREAAGERAVHRGGRRVLRLAAVGLVVLASLPPLLWVGQAVGTGGVAAMNMVGLGVGTLLALLSGGLAALIWHQALRPRGAAVERADARVRQLARHDLLTGLDNRVGLLAAIRRALQRQVRLRRKHGERRARVGVLALDIDRFRMVNESLGRPMGDKLLLAVAMRLRAQLGARERLARAGGDQFVVLLDAIDGAESMAALARNILRAFEPALLVGGRPVALTLSAGGAIADPTSLDPDELLLQAEQALRMAKSDGGATYRAYDPSMRGDERDALDLPVRLRRAMADGKFEIVFQPVVRSEDSTLIGVEALLRWVDPIEGDMPPAQFIPVLEQTGLIVPAGKWVLIEACRQALPWARRRHAPLTLSVNASPRQFGEDDFVPSVVRALEETGFPPSRLQLEVTEGLLLEPQPATLEKLAALVALGVRIAVDDFGIGYSSLAYLKRYPLATLKIDRLFVRDVCRDAKDRAIVRAVLELGRGLGLTVVAEGVEDQAQCDVLRALGCPAMQGYFFSRPVVPAQIERLLRAQTVDEDATGDWPSTTLAMSLDPLARPAGR